ncbi:hypothetical protein LJ207_11745 [Halanaerobium sp. Z-7514]|uniref:Uncharacterized protein n=1 Tax=Halanaerobium polyolivorans TaxID=2886943 RepID=A0AAW4X2B4_9FIRM|nr:hypothetical protein [Halanaerobium polyolivorans]MCC3145987.1 hypothetical protein [Halanaerobium polyolivorans]
MSSIKDYLAKIVSEYKEARLHEEFAEHEPGDLTRHQLPDYLVKELSSNFKTENYIIKLQKKN